MPATEKCRVSLATAVAAAGTSVARAEFPEHHQRQTVLAVVLEPGEDGPRVNSGRK